MMWHQKSPLHLASCAHHVDALLTVEGADPALRDMFGWTPLMWYASQGHLDCALRILQDERAISSLNVRVQLIRVGCTALHLACHRPHDTIPAATRYRMIQILLDAGANPLLRNAKGQIPSDLLVKRPCNRRAHVLLQAKIDDHARNATLVHIRRLALAAAGGSATASWVQTRKDHHRPLPSVDMVVENTRHQRNNKSRSLRKTLAFVLDTPQEMEQERRGMPKDVFLVMMDMLMPAWDPLRYRQIL